MLQIKAINEKPLNLFFVGIISCFLGIMILLYDYRASIFLILMCIIFVFFVRVEYVFYFFLASRSIVDILYNVEAAGNVRISHYIGIFIIILFMSYFIISGYNIFRLGINKIYLTFMLFAIFPIFFSQNLVSGLRDWLKLLLPFFIFNMTILIVRQADGKLYKERLIIICWVTIAALFIPFVLFLKNYTQGISVEMGGYARYATLGASTNVFSYYLLTVFPVCLFLYSISQKKPVKIFWLVFMAIMLLTVYKTYTRNVWIGVAIIIFTWYLFRKNYKPILIALILVITMIMFNHEMQDRFSEISGIYSNIDISRFDYKIMSNRGAIWFSNIDYFLHKSTFVEKLLGNGFDVKTRIEIVNRNLKESLPEHNNYLSLLMNTGICGLIIYNIYILKLFQESFKLLRNTKETYLKNLAQIFISILCAYVIISFFTHMIWKFEYQYYFSALGGIIVAANILEDKRRETRIDRNDF